MLIKSGLLTQMSGSIGGITGSHNRGGLYLRARTIPVDPATFFQTAIRTIFATLVARWNTSLTQVQRDDWDLYASLVTLPGPLGDPITTSGQNQYVRSNTPRLQALQPVIDNAPAQFDTGDQGVVTLTNVVAGLNITFDVNFDPTRPWANVVGGFLLVYIGRPQNPSISYFRGPWRFVGSIAGDPVPPASPVNFQSPFSGFVGQRQWLRTRASENDARLTLPEQAGPVVSI